MARSLDTISTQMLNKVASYTALSGLSSLSNSAIFRLFIKVVIAPAVYLFDVIIDNNKTTLENLIQTPQGSTAWVKKKIQEFQYGYVPTYGSNGSVKYDTIDTTARIITSCTIRPKYDLSAYGIYGHPKFNPANAFVIGISKGTPPVVLSTDEMNAASAYINDILPFAASYTIESYNSDLLYIVGTVYYDGNDTGIQAKVFDAIRTYTYNIPNDGMFYIYDLSDAIKAVTNVKDVYIKEIGIRKAADTWANRSTIYRHDLTSPLAIGSLGASYKTTTGALVQETDSGHTWTDKIQFTRQ